MYPSLLITGRWSHLAERLENSHSGGLDCFGSLGIRRSDVHHCRADRAVA